MFLVTLKSGYITLSPSFCTAAITGPIVEQSRRNCTGSRVQHSVASEEGMGNLFRKDQQTSIMSALVAARDGQDSRRDSTVPLWLVPEPQHDVKEHNPVLFHGTQ